MSSYTDLFAVCDAALEPTGTICFANKLACFGVVSNLVVHFRTRQTTRFRSRTDRDRFYGRDRHHCLSQQPVKLQIPRRVRTEARHDSTRRDLKNAAEGVSLPSRFVDYFDHLLLCVNVGTVQRCIVRNCGELIPTQLEWRLGNAAELNHVTANFNSKHCEQLLCECAAGDTRSGFTS